MTGFCELTQIVTDITDFCLASEEGCKCPAEIKEIKEMESYFLASRW